MNAIVRGALLGVCLLSASLVTQAAVILDTTYNWSLDGSEDDQTGRLTRNGVASDWGAPKANPGLFNSTLQDYVLYALNSGLYDRIQVTVQQITNHNVYGAVYSLYDPADPTSGYLADGGLSSGTPPTDVVFRFDSAQGAAFAVVLSSVNGVGSVAGASTRLLVEGFSTTEAPEPATVSLLGAGLLAMGIAARRRSRRA